MKQGSVILSALPQADGKLKLRPALLLKQLPGHGDWLLCGISSQLHQFIPGFDLLIDTDNKDYKKSGLKKPGVVRLGFLSVIPTSAIAGSIGEISNDNVKGLLKNLSDYLIG